jgi:hypothetical protein
MHMTVSNAVPRFRPSTDGLHFANRFAPGPTVRFGPIDPRWFGIGDARNGLCGGMSWYVRERFVTGLPIPPDTDGPANGSPLFKAIVRRQVLSLDGLRTPLRFWRMAAGGAGRAHQGSLGAEWPRVRAEIDAGRLSMLGLVRQAGWNPFTLTENHQVLAFAYAIDDDTITIRIYDPNWPGRDDVAVKLGPGPFGQSTGEPLLGVLGLT